MRRAAATGSALLVVLLTSCGQQPAGIESGGPAPGRSVVQITASSVTATATGLALEVEVPVGAPGCASDPEARVTAHDRRTVWVSTTAMAALEPDCDEVSRRTVTVDVSLRGRRLVVNDEQWEPGRAAAYVTCGPHGCDPPTDRCDPVWTQDLGATADLPTERHLDVVTCDPPWLVADLSATLTGCVPLEGASPPPGCEGDTRRWFGRLEAGAWQVVASASTGGCREVLDQVPDFPRRLCEGLGPLP